MNVIACNVADTDGTWCCAYDGNCCSGSSTFIPGFGTMFAEPGNSLTTLAVASGSTSVAASTTSSSSTTETSLSPATVSTSSSATNTPVASVASPASATPTIVGAAVGVPLGLAVVASLFFLYRERKKHTNPESGHFGMKKLEESGDVSPAPNAQPVAEYYAPKAYGEMEPRPPHFELGTELNHELGER